MGVLRRNHVAARSAVERHFGTIGFVILALAVIGGFIRVEMIQTQLDQRDTERALLLCEVTNDNKRVITGFLRELFIEQEQDLPDHELEDRDRRIGQLEDGILAPTECQEIINADGTAHEFTP
jgi:hypothetical protein